MRQYKTQVSPLDQISHADRLVMARLYFDYFDGATEEMFLADLAGKTEALLVYHEGRLIGFSTLQTYGRNWQGRAIRIVFSGDTIVARAHWGQQALAFAWIQHMGTIYRLHPSAPLYWFLIVKGHRTFRYLPVFSKSFHPHYSMDRADLRPLADFLAAEKFGKFYDPVSGLVVFPASRGHLKQEIATPSATELEKAAVQFFLRKNPGYTRGDELVCLCELRADNLKPLARRLFLKAQD